jgi:hypothetical protein
MRKNSRLSASLGKNSRSASGLQALFYSEEKFPVACLVGLGLAAWTCRSRGTLRARKRRSGMKESTDFLTADEGTLRRYVFDANVRD